VSSRSTAATGRPETRGLRARRTRGDLLPSESRALSGSGETPPQLAGRSRLGRSNANAAARSRRLVMPSLL
jgi:hypothetical protein